jgi:aspartate aminotransferase
MFPYVGDILKKTGMSVKDFVIKLIEEKGVTTIPGEVFPLDVGKDFIRLSFAVNENDIIEGVKRMGEYINMLMTP